MIRILHYGLSPNRGGIENYLLKIWKNIDHDEFRFDFVDEWDGNAFYREAFEKEGCRFFNVTQRKFSLIKNQKDWIRAIKESEADIVHCHLNTMSYDTPIRCALKYGVKTIVHSRSSGSKKALTTQILHGYHKYKYRNTDFTRLAVSKKAGDWLFGANVPFTVINNGVDTEKYKFSEDNRKKIRDELGINKDTLVVGNVGAFLPVKNHIFMLDVFNEVLRINPSSVLVLCGEGFTRNKAEERAKEIGIDGRVIFTGNRSDIPAVLSALDVFVMPSLFEGFPNAVLEAQTSGLRCVLSDVITDEVDAGKCCYLNINDGAEKWAEVIVKNSVQGMENDYRNNSYKEIGSKGFSVQQEIAKLEEIYREIMKND